MSQSASKQDPSERADTSSAAILIVSYNGREFLADCLDSIFASGDAPPREQIIVVDNASTDGSADVVAQRYPGVRLLRLETNSGFTGGNNTGVELIRRELPAVKYVALLNQDTIVAPLWLAALVHLAETRQDAGAIQAKLLFHPEKHLINSAGNKSHYLGFGFVSAYREEDRGQHDAIRELAFCSGAAMLIRLSDVTGDLFDPEYFAYLEDAELGWRLRLSGRKNLYCPQSVVYHRYHFSRNPQMYYRLESNRWRLLLTCYRWRTLVLILPAVLMMEGGLLFYFLRVGAMKQKGQSWRVFGQIGEIMRRREHLQRARTVSDRELTAPFVAAADFAEVRNPLLSYVGNPLLRGYWALARMLLWW